MEYIIEILRRQWNINAMDMEYMIIGSVELDEAFEKQKYIEDMIEVLQGEIDIES